MRGRLQKKDFRRGSAHCKSYEYVYRALCSIPFFLQKEDFLQYA